MIAPLVLVFLIAQTPGTGSQERPLKQASSAPNPVKPPKPPKPEKPWPPAGVFRPGGDVTEPKVTKERKPNYTGESMRARVQGSVFLEAVVLTDGTVGEVRVVRSLDKEHGLDDEAVKTVKEWRFTPGTKNGVVVPVVVEIQMSFTLGN
jgi:periplasmic protein TonB